LAEDSDSREASSELDEARRLLSSTAIRALAEDRWQRWRPWLDGPLLVVFVLAVSALFSPLGPRVHAVPPLDGIATETVRAERDVLVEDKGATELRRQASVDAALPAYGYDPELYFSLGDHVSDTVQAMAERAADESLTVAERRQAFEADLGQPVDAGAFTLIEGLENPTDLAVAITFFLNIGLDRMVVASRSELPTDREILVRNISLDLSRPVSPLASVIDLRQLERLIRARAGDAPYGSARVVRTWALRTATELARPNLVFNQAATAEGLERALAAVEPVYLRIGRGEVVVREGDRVTALIQDRIHMLNEGAEQRTLWSETLAFAALLSGLLVLGAFFFRRARQPLRLGRKASYLALSIVLSTALICIVAFYAGRGLADGLGFGVEWAAYLMPVALVTVLVSLLVDSRTSLLAGVGLSLLASYRADGDMWLVTYYVIAVLVAGVTVRHCRRRSDLLKMGIAIGFSQALAVPVIVVLSGAPLDAQQLSTALAALASGAILAILAMSLMPLLEYLFNETTDMRLMEMASADNPLLKELALRSPGTYYHSVVMGNLAEAGAAAIGANALQSRVMALYHDIGKMRRPSYFAENQRGGNIHDRLTPELSARVIFAHIKDGIDIAVKQRLGRPVIDAITQHQGTTLLKVFYAKALQRGQATGVAVKEEDFRYPGPRPMSKEAGMLMIADAAEASTRALVDPSPSEVQEKIHEVIGERVADGQLDDCQLTLKDLAAVEAAFVRVVSLGVFHTRIEYPPMPGKEAPHDDGEQARRRGIDPLRSLADRSS
jgi:putative nucleotidyltransferase with HDIG domain